MKIELHCHTAPRSKCAVSSPDDLLNAYVIAGYQAVFLTEHDTVWPTEELMRLQSRHPRIRLYPGIERSLGPGGHEHLLILGTNNPIFLRGDNAGQVIRKARRAGHTTVLAHPFLTTASPSLMKLGILPDAIECHTCSHNHLNARRSVTIARKVDVALVDSGDVHHVSQINTYWIETEYPMQAASELRYIIGTGLYRRCSSDSG